MMREPFILAASSASQSRLCRDVGLRVS